ncbi:MAG TPA: hypothetical protein VN847_15520 [Streptosporangiaceae bacterium]|nr:hypothetical protein [Streptosporangiaceae bacterium]
MTVRLTRPARIEAAALTAAAAGIIIQIIAGVHYGPVPPGLIILLAAAALVVFVPWRWAPLLGLLPGVFLFIGGFVSTTGRHDLSHPGHPGAFGGTLIEIIALGVAVVAGVIALAVSRRR